MVGKAVVGVAMLALAGFIEAQPHGGRFKHAMAHQNYKRDIVTITITRTHTVQWRPQATDPPKVDNSPDPKPKPKPKPEPEPEPEAPPAPIVPPPTPQVEENNGPTEQGGTQKTTIQGGTGGRKPVGNYRGIVYSAKDDGGQCLSDAAVKQRLDTLPAEYNLIRVYGPDCEQVRKVLDNSDREIFAGVWCWNNFECAYSDLKQIAEQVKGRWDRVHTISVGNERVNDGLMSAGELRNLVSRIRAAARDEFGYQGNVVTTDTLVATVGSRDLCDAGDYIAVNCHPFFDQHIGAPNAGKFIVDQVRRLKEFCNNGKEVMVTETGWPKRGARIGQFREDQLPSKPNQIAAIADIKAALGDKYILLSAWDEKWKGEGSNAQFSAESSWGVLDR